jgi:hypothetical protein
MPTPRFSAGSQNTYPIFDLIELRFCFWANGGLMHCNIIGEIRRKNPRLGNPMWAVSGWLVRLT